MRKLTPIFFFIVSTLFLYNTQVYAQSQSGGSVSSTVNPSPLSTSTGFRSDTSCFFTRVGDPEDLTPTFPPECSPTRNIGPGNIGIPDGTPNGACIPTGEYPNDMQQELLDQYGITMQGYDQEHIKYVYDLFTCLSGTRFAGLVYGTTLINGSGPNYGTIEMNCPGVGGNCTIWITQMPGRGDTFKFILTHEFGHIIQYRNPRNINFEVDLQNANAQEGAISLYGRSGLSCNGAGNWYEDYAETIAYFLHPNAGQTTPACDPDKSPPNPFFELNQFPLHLDVAKKILL